MRKLSLIFCKEMIIDHDDDNDDDDGDGVGGDCDYDDKEERR